MKYLLLRLSFIIIIVTTFSCSGKKNELTDMQLYQMLSYLMFVQFESEGYSLDFKVLTEDSLNFSKKQNSIPNQPVCMKPQNPTGNGMIQDGTITGIM